MSVQAVRTEIRAALGDATLTVDEARKIVAAAKRNVDAGELIAISELVEKVELGEVQGVDNALNVLNSAIFRGAFAKTFGETLVESLSAPMQPFKSMASSLDETTQKSSNPVAFAACLLASWLCEAFGAIVTVLLSPLTVLIGLCRGLFGRFVD